MALGDRFYCVFRCCFRRDDWLHVCVSGPKLFVKPSAKSNRHIIMNAISHCCLAGTVNTEVKNKVLEVRSQQFCNLHVKFCKYICNIRERQNMPLYPNVGQRTYMHRFKPCWRSYSTTTKKMHKRKWLGVEKGWGLAGMSDERKRKEKVREQKKLNRDMSLELRQIT